MEKEEVKQACMDAISELLAKEKLERNMSTAALAETEWRIPREIRIQKLENGFIIHGDLGKQWIFGFENPEGLLNKVREFLIASKINGL